jgi:Mg/Co/Ni transporter MgtE
MSSVRRALALARAPPILRTALSVSVVVGCLLNAINQGSAILSHYGISWFHVALNFAVPYLGATYSAVRSTRDRDDSADGLVSSSDRQRSGI